MTCSLLPLLHGTGWLGMKILSGLRPRRCRIPPRLVSGVGLLPTGGKEEVREEEG